ncbi:hypothetical protein [Bradyrhizobium sp. LB14.3]|uniref:ABC transporter ATP-binding protein n=1 Tax=Bradyrhizobium sp. LB14.3 TaxID=3156328 RepID=UPI00339277FB
MHEGEVLERGSADQVFQEPQHAYTRQLLDAVPSARPRGSRLSRLPAARPPRPQSRSFEQLPGQLRRHSLRSCSARKPCEGVQRASRRAADDRRRCLL